MVAHQAPLSMVFPRQEYWDVLHSPLQGILSTQGSKSYLHWQAGSFHWATWETLREPFKIFKGIENSEINDLCLKYITLGGFPSGPLVKTLPSHPGSVGLIPGWGARIPHATWPKSQNIKQKQYCNKFIKDLKVHISLFLEQAREDSVRLTGKLLS